LRINEILQIHEIFIKEIVDVGTWMDDDKDNRKLALTFGGGSKLQDAFIERVQLI
jgi:hypothetical protein